MNDGWDSEGLGCELIVIKGAGHGANEQNRDEVNAVIEANVLEAAKRYSSPSASSISSGNTDSEHRKQSGKTMMEFAPVAAKL